MSLKTQMQSLLKGVGLYDRLKASSLYDAYWRLADPKILVAKNNEVRFYRETLEGFKSGDLIFDVGANQGYKTQIFLTLGARVIAVDPDRANQETLRQKFLRYRLVAKPVTIIGKALSDASRKEKMWVDAPGSAKNTLSKKWMETLQTDDTRFGQRLNFGSEIEVETTTLDELIQSYGRPFFIKIDVEGYEPEVLRGLHQPVPFLSFEVNLPEFQSEGLRCLDLLGDISSQGQFNYATDCQGKLTLPDWLPHRQFREMFGELSDSSLEVFWRTPR